MVAWWEGLNLFQQILACITIPASLILVIQFILLLIGLGDSDSFDGVEEVDLGDADSINDTSFTHLGGLKLISLRGIIAFLSIGGWVSIGLIAGGMADILAAVIGILCGGLAMFGVAYVMKAAMKMQSSGNLDLMNAIGCTATVYIPIPAKRQGRGKVTLTVQERFLEVEAETSSEDKLATGMSVKVDGVIGENTLLVSPFDNK